MVCLIPELFRTRSVFSPSLFLSSFFLAPSFLLSFSFSPSLRRDVFFGSLLLTFHLLEIKMNLVVIVVFLSLFFSLHHLFLLFLTTSTRYGQNSPYVGKFCSVLSLAHSLSHPRQQQEDERHTSEERKMWGEESLNEGRAWVRVTKKKTKEISPNQREKLHLQLQSRIQFNFTFELYLNKHSNNLLIYRQYNLMSFRMFKILVSITNHGFSITYFKFMTRLLFLTSYVVYSECIQFSPH